MLHKTIRESLQFVADHPVPVDDPLDMPVWEHISRALFELANNPNPKVRGAMTRATRAQQMILDRLVGQRRAGSRPLNGGQATVSFVDLTAGLIEGAPADE